MIAVDVKINNTTEVAHLSATRIYPKDREPEDGEECEYQLKYWNEPVGTLRHRYGCGISLAIEMLKYYASNEQFIKHVAMKQKIEQFEIMKNAGLNTDDIQIT